MENKQYKELVKFTPEAFKLYLLFCNERMTTMQEMISLVNTSRYRVNNAIKEINDNSDLDIRRFGNVYYISRG